MNKEELWTKMEKLERENAQDFSTMKIDDEDLDNIIDELLDEWKNDQGLSYDAIAKRCGTTTFNVYQNFKLRRTSPYSRMRFAVDKIGIPIQRICYRILIECEFKREMFPWF